MRSTRGSSSRSPIRLAPRKDAAPVSATTRPDVFFPTGACPRPRSGTTERPSHLGYASPPMSASIHPAPLVLGPYEPIERIATGGMAEVYLSRRAGPHGFQKVVAVSASRPSSPGTPLLLRLASVRGRGPRLRPARPSQHRAGVRFPGSADGEPRHGEMEYVDGNDPAARVLNRAADTSRGEEVPPEAALYIALQRPSAASIYARSVRVARTAARSPSFTCDVSPGRRASSEVSSGAVPAHRFLGTARCSGDRAAHRTLASSNRQARLHVPGAGRGVGGARRSILAATVPSIKCFAPPFHPDVPHPRRSVLVIDCAGPRVPDDVKAIRAMGATAPLLPDSRTVRGGGDRRGAPAAAASRSARASLAAWDERLGLAPSVHEERDSETGTRQTASPPVQPTGSSPSAGAACRRRCPRGRRRRRRDARGIAPIYRAKMPGGPTSAVRLPAPSRSCSSRVPSITVLLSARDLAVPRRDATRS